MRSSKLLWLVTPTLYAIFPVLFLYAHNAHEMRFGDILSPLLAIATIVAVLTVGLRLILKDGIKAGLTAAVWVILFFSYGHFASLWGQSPSTSSGLWSNADKILLPIWMALGLSTAVFFSRVKWDFVTPLKMLAILGVVLVSMQVIKITIGGQSTIESKKNEEGAGLKISQNDLPRDIYLIILDGYGRQDILKNMYDYDNSEFIAYLRRKGFFVADSAHSNYGQTLQTLASVLNMDYIQNLARFDPKSDDRKALHDKYIHNRVMASLKRVGYRTIAYESGYSLTEFKRADDYIVSDWKSSEFGNILLSTTPLPRIFDRYFSPYEIHRRRILNTLEGLASRPADDHPNFVLAHIIAPHPPFVFDADGGRVDNDLSFHMGDGSHYTDAGGSLDAYIEGYRNQLQFINRRMTGVIDTLLDCPEDMRPIIIIMGDHGPGSQLSWVGSATTNLNERFSILYALFLPDQDLTALSHSVTPVNTFRTIFNACFGTEYAMLEAASYYATWNAPFEMYRINKDTLGHIHEQMLAVYRDLSPHQVEYRHVSHPKTQGTPCDAEDCFMMDRRGVTVRLHKVLDSKYMEYSIDHNDTYMIYFRLDSTIIAAGEIDPHIIPGGGLRVERSRVPEEAVRRGFNNVLIIPVAGDGKYGFGHIRFASGIKN